MREAFLWFLVSERVEWRAYVRVVCVCAVVGRGGGRLGVWALYALLEKWEINLL